MKKIASSVTDLIGNTPLIQLNNINKNIIAKCEFMNPTSSIKDRVAKSMITESLESGLINLDTTLIEPTSGNTGIALASICASLGIKLIITMPESMSLERRQILLGLGVTLELTPKELGMEGSIQRAEYLNKTIENSYILGQFDNINNPFAHENTTVKEIIKDTNGEIDIFVSVVGTGGTLTGIAKQLKKYNKDILVVAVEPENSAVLSGKRVGNHQIQGIGAGFIPKILDTTLYDDIVTISDENAINTAKRLATEEGLIVGISSGANVFASLYIAEKYPNKKILTILPDTGERYLSSDLYPQN